MWQSKRYRHTHTHTHTHTLSQSHTNHDLHSETQQTYPALCTLIQMANSEWTAHLDRLLNVNSYIKSSEFQYETWFFCPSTRHHSVYHAPHTFCHRSFHHNALCPLRDSPISLYILLSLFISYSDRQYALFYRSRALEFWPCENQHF